MTAQFLGLVKVTLRDWIRPVYKKNADTVAFQLVGLSVLMFFIGLTALFYFPAIEQLHQLPLPVTLVVLLVVTYPFSRYFLEGARPEIGAEVARTRWPRLANHALTVSIGFCLACFLPLAIFFVFFD